MMYIHPVKTRPGSYEASIPNVFTGEKEEIYFGVSTRAHPKLVGELAVSKRLSQLYGNERADWIVCIPNFINRMKFGCGVSVIRSRTSSRGKVYPQCRVIWTEYNQKTGRSPRCSKSYSLTGCPVKDREIEHRAGLFAAQKRAELSLSKLDAGVLTLEFDLEI
ncbi:hypothetical protein MM188_003192 [Vibrio cholerae]|nr:hypothetical protein [Vibrio cholerae]